MRTSSLYMPKPAAPHVYLWLIYTNISVILLVTRGGEGSTSAGRARRRGSRPLRLSRDPPRLSTQLRSIPAAVYVGVARRGALGRGTNVNSRDSAHFLTRLFTYKV